MTGAAAMLSYTVAEPYDGAVRMVRQALARQELSVVAEFDVARRFRRELGTVLAPSLVLYVDDPALLLEATVFHRGASLLIPQPVVISGDGRASEVLVMSAGAQVAANLPRPVVAPLRKLHARIVKALEAVGERDEYQVMSVQAVRRAEFEERSPG